MQPITIESVIRFFLYRRQVSAALLADTEGMETPQAQALIRELVDSGYLTFDGDTYRTHECPITKPRKRICGPQCGDNGQCPVCDPANPYDYEPPEERGTWERGN